MPTFGAAAISNDWLSGGNLQDAVSLGQPSVAPREQTSWASFSPSIVVHGVDDTGYNTTGSRMMMMDAYHAQHPDKNLVAPLGGAAATTGTTLGGDWSGVDQWSSGISAAAAATGVDPNDLKGIMKLESNGDPGATGSPGVGGLMQVNSSVWGSGPWQTDNAANILKGAQIYKSYLDQYGGDKRMALRAYHGFGSDGNTSDQQYADIVLGNIQTLNAGGAATTGAGFPTGTSQGLTTIFGGGANVQDWGGFNIPSSNGLYGYGTAYGLNGVNHTGVDVVVPYGTAYRAAFSGRVVCGGTNNGAGADGTQGCAAFPDAIGGGAGRVEVQSDDGNTVIIYGHSSRSDFAPGQRVTAGQLLGVSGGENSAHVHVEVRVRDASTLSGWRIVDPAPYINGGVIPTGGGGTYSTPSTPMDIWRANHLGGVSTPATSDPWAAWRAR